MQHSGEIWLWLGAIGAFALDKWAPLAHTLIMAERLITVAETPIFLRQAKEIWSEAEHDEFVLCIAGDPEAGTVIPETGGVRKVRWAGQGPASAAAFA